MVNLLTVLTGLVFIAFSIWARVSPDSFLRIIPPVGSDAYVARVMRYLPPILFIVGAFALVAGLMAIARG